MSESERLCLEVLKTIGKTLSQMNLYNPAHPAVRAMLAEAVRVLSTILAEIPEGTLAYSLDADKVIANGRIVGPVRDLPSSIGNTFTRFKLNSVTFAAGVTEEELSAFCQLAALRPEAAKTVVPAKFLSEKGVSRILLNEALYAKVDRLPDGSPAPAETGAPAGGPSGASAAGTPGSGGAVEGMGEGGGGTGGAAEAVEKVQGEPIEKTIEVLAHRATMDRGEQSRIYGTVMQKIRAELEVKVQEATRELKRQATTLQNEQVRTQAVLSNVAEGVVVVDDSGRVLMMNPAAEELYGSSLAEMAGKPLSEHVKEEHLLALSKETVVPNDKPVQGEVAVSGKDDTRRTLRASTAIVQTEAGKPVGVVSTLSDVTKYREAQKMQREFVAHVTHELRSPLTAIRAALEILEGAVSSKLKADEQRIMTNALRNTDRLEDLVNSILDFSKIESGQMTVYPKPARPELLVQESLDSMLPWVQKKGLRVETACPSSLPTVNADPKRTVQVFVNLLSNAIKFTPAGGTVRIGAGPSRDGSRAVCFFVSDTGPGIPKADQQKIFEKFIQIASGEKHVGGTGLGLAIAKAFVHLQQGQMWVESEPGKGANFQFTLPCYIPTAEEVAARPVAKPKPWWKRLLGLK
ncbi:MAG: ATP-binding protein [Elusimicrobiota bacterium]|jgi:PAS domain S-box-containing protein